MALTVCGALTEVRGQDVLNNIETHSRNHFILRLKFVVTIKKGKKGQITHLLLKVTTTTHRQWKSTFCAVKKPLARVAGSDLTELGCGWNAGDRKRLHVVGGVFFVPTEHHQQI